MIHLVSTPIVGLARRETRLSKNRMPPWWTWQAVRLPTQREARTTVAP
jgi:hypothetical protein